MNNSEWETTWVEQNAKAEMIGSAIAVGCVGIPIIVFVFLVFVVILTA